MAVIRARRRNGTEAVPYRADSGGPRLSLRGAICRPAGRHVGDALVATEGVREEVSRVEHLGGAHRADEVVGAQRAEVRPRGGDDGDVTAGQRVGGRITERQGAIKTWRQGADGRVV